jgi:hypothetical protein
MQFQPGKPRSSSGLASLLAAAGIVLTVTSCAGHLTPLGPDAVPQPHHLGSPIVLRAILSQPPTATGRCPAGYTKLSVPAPDASLCSRPLGAPVTLTSAAVSAPTASPASPVPAQQAQQAQQGQQGQPSPAGELAQPGQAGQAGQAAGPTPYGIMIAVPTADVAAVTAVVRQAYDSRGAVDISVAGKTWATPEVIKPFPGRQLEIVLPTRSQFLQLQHLLVPPG